MQRNQGKQNDPVKRYLWGYRAIVRRIDALRRERDRAEQAVNRLDNAYDRATRATSRMTATRVSGTGQHDSMANAVMDIIQWRAEAKKGGERSNAITLRIDREILAAADALAVRLDLINQLSDERYKTLMVMRYVDGMEWTRIAKAMSYSLDYVYELHGYALVEIRKIMRW